MTWGSNPIGDFGPEIPTGVTTQARSRDADVIPIHAEQMGGAPQPAPQVEVVAQPPQHALHAQQQQQPQLAPAGLALAPPPIRELALHVAPLLVAGVAGGLGGWLVGRSMKGAGIGAATSIGFIGLARALAGGVYQIPMQLRMMDGALAVGGAVLAGYLTFMSGAPKKRKPAKTRRFGALQREDDFDEFEDDEVDETSDAGDTEVKE